MSHDNPPDLTAEFVRLMGETERRLRAFVLSLVPHWADADEIIQQTRVRIWEQFADYDRSKDFGAWARSIAYYMVLAHREKSLRLPKLQSPEFMELVAQRFEASPPVIEDRERALQNCLKKLSKEGRRLLAQFYGDGLSQAEIAAVMKISVNAVKQRMARSRSALAECVARTIRVEGDE